MTLLLLFGWQGGEDLCFLDLPNNVLNLLFSSSMESLLYSSSRRDNEPSVCFVQQDADS